MCTWDVTSQLTREVGFICIEGAEGHPPNSQKTKAPHYPRAKYIRIKSNNSYESSSSEEVILLSINSFKCHLDKAQHDLFPSFALNRCHLTSSVIFTSQSKLNLLMLY